MLEHQDPLTLIGPRASPTASESGGLHITLLSGRGLLLLQSRSPREQLNELLQPVLGLDLPRAAQVARPGVNPARPEITEPPVQAALWLGPGQWLLDLPTSTALLFLHRLREALQTTASSAITAVLDCSDALCHLEVHGPQVTAALARSCRLDLSLGSFPVDRVARTPIADVGTVLWRLEAERFRCLIERGLAHHFLHWLRQW